MHHVGDECTGDGSFNFAFGAVVNERTSSFKCRTGMGEVVRQHLLALGAAGLGEMFGGSTKQLRCALDDGGSSGEVFE